MGNADMVSFETLRAAWEKLEEADNTATDAERAQITEEFLDAIVGPVVGPDDPDELPTPMLSWAPPPTRSDAEVDAATAVRMARSSGATPSSGHAKKRLPCFRTSSASTSRQAELPATALAPPGRTKAATGPAILPRHGYLPLRRPGCFAIAEPHSNAGDFP